MNDRRYQDYSEHELLKKQRDLERRREQISAEQDDFIKGFAGSPAYAIGTQNYQELTEQGLTIDQDLREIVNEFSMRHNEAKARRLKREARGD
jgi:hypothetical protein